MSQFIHHEDNDPTNNSLRNLLVIRTTYWAKLIPIRQFDWEATCDDHGGEGPVGRGATEQEAIRDFLEQLMEWRRRIVREDGPYA